MKTPAVLLISVIAGLASCAKHEKQGPRLDGAPLSQQYRLKNYPQDANGLSCGITSTRESKGDGSFIFFLKNISNKPITISGFIAPWQSESPQVVTVLLGFEGYISDRPTDSQIRQSLVVIMPGNSFSIPVNIGANTKGIAVEVGYGISEEVGKKFGIWYGEIAASSKTAVK